MSPFEEYRQQHFAAWCAVHDFVPLPAAPATVGAYLASLAESHAPNTIRRRLAALGKMHRFNDLPWNPAHRDIQGPLQGLLRLHGRPPRKAAPLTLALLRQLVATCDVSARGRRDRALLLFGFVGALRRSELVALQVEDVAEVAGGLRLRIPRSKTDRAGQGAEIGLPRGRHAETCPVLAFAAWQAVAKRRAGLVFRKSRGSSGCRRMGGNPGALGDVDQDSCPGRGPHSWRRHHSAGSGQEQNGTSRLWTYVRDDRPFGDDAKPAAL